jgi:hypothetical protein
MSQVVDLFVLYKLIKAISTPFDETDAFELGLIDDKGKLIRKPKTSAEKDAYDHFDRFVFNIKRILQKVGLDKRYATYAGALLLMREGADQLSNQQLEQALYEEYNYLLENSNKTFGELKDEMVTTGPAVAGTGDDPVHWGKPKGRPRAVGRAISGVQYLKRRKRNSANTVSSSYPRNAGKVE